MLPDILTNPGCIEQPRAKFEETRQNITRYPGCIEQPRAKFEETRQNITRYLAEKVSDNVFYYASYSFNPSALIANMSH